jgi:hypothetical protein
MKPEDVKAKLMELRAVIVEKLADLEQDPNWAGEEERKQLATELDDVAEQLDKIRDLLRN